MKKRIVLDTNIILVCASRRSRHNWVVQALLNNEYELCVTTEILMEYAEIIEQKMGVRASQAFMATLDNRDNVRHINTFYEFQLLTDEDDNKFVDCAIAANALFIVSHDSDFRRLNKIEFPIMEVIDLEEFKARMETLNSE